MAEAEYTSSRASFCHQKNLKSVERLISKHIITRGEKQPRVILSPLKLPPGILTTEVVHDHTVNICDLLCAYLIAESFKDFRIPPAE